MRRCHMSETKRATSPASATIATVPRPSHSRSSSASLLLGGACPEVWLPGITPVGPDSMGQSQRYRCVAIAKTGYGILGSQGTPGSRGTWGPLSMCQKRPRCSLSPALLPPRRVGDHVAVLPEEGLDDLEDPWVADGLLDDTAPIEHLVAERGGLLRQVTPFVWRVLREDTLDIGAERRELLTAEDSLEEDVPVFLQVLHRGGCRAGTECEVPGRSSQHAPILPPIDGAGTKPASSGAVGRAAAGVGRDAQPHSKSLRRRDLPEGSLDAGSCTASARLVLSQAMSPSASSNSIS